MIDRSIVNGSICMLVALSLALPGCGTSDEQEGVLQEPEFTAEGTLDFLRPDGSVIVRIAVELAESREEQTVGLMRRRSLPARGGMLFVYEDDQPQRFWMKNTPLPLDIVFISSDSSIVNIARRTTPLSEQSIESEAPARFVLELRGGFIERYGIDENARIEWRRI